MITSTCSTTTIVREPTYTYKGKSYSIIQYSKIKYAGSWKDVVIYKCNYHNPEGNVWVRFVDEFFLLFKIEE